MERMIEKKIPMPKRGRWMELVSHMEKGDSVYLETEKDAAAMYMAFKQAKRKSVRRKEHDGFRVWAL